MSGEVAFLGGWCLVRCLEGSYDTVTPVFSTTSCLVRSGELLRGADRLQVLSRIVKRTARLLPLIRLGDPLPEDGVLVRESPVANGVPRSYIPRNGFSVCVLF